MTTTFGSVFPVTSSVMGLANVPFVLSGDREPGEAGGSASPPSSLSTARRREPRCGHRIRTSC
ncbi:hypothetical protein BST44_20705 [Mycobacterium scrofulaceum]|uniref:Uncharacterized protein n=1 Tax=Mycobacterium scrofulaceum TaxID=1783 RepID=A0A1X0KBG1_MYCSC|nr:hypothetical protein BST44_20705 [Mycobacterium scrofulaceum]